MNTMHIHAPPSTMKESFNKRHLNDIWRAPMKRPSPHSEVGSTEQNQVLRTPFLLGQGAVAQS